MVPKGWQVKPISELLDRVNRPVTIDPNLTYREIGIRSHCKGIFHKSPTTGKSLGNKRVFHIEPDCFVVNIVFAWEQAVAKTTKHELGMIASHRFPMFQPKNNNCDIDYILYLFKTEYGKYLLGLASPGGAGRNKTLGQAEFSRLEILVPPVEEQRKIAKIITTWDQAINTSEKLLNNSKQRKKALMQQLLTCKKRFPAFKEKWQETTLEKLVHIDSGTSKSQHINNAGNNLIIDMGSVSRDGKLIPTKKTNLAANFLIKGQLVMPKDDIGGGNIIGRVGYIDVDHKYILGDHVYALTAKNSDSLFLSYLINSHRVNKSLRRKANGTAQLGLGKSDVLKQPVTIPQNIAEQQKIAALFAIADRDIETFQQKVNCLKREKEALMQQLLTGKSRVKV